MSDKKNGTPDPAKKLAEFEALFADPLLRATGAAADATVLVLSVATLFPVIKLMMVAATNVGDAAALSVANMTNSEAVATATLARSVNEILDGPTRAVRAMNVAAETAPVARKSVDDVVVRDDVIIREDIYPNAFYGRPVVT
jgi:hypothetical protein